MKVVHIQTGMSPAGNAAFRLHLLMKHIGIESTVLTYLPTIKRNHVYNYPKSLLFYFYKITNHFYAKYYNKPLDKAAYLYNIFPICGNDITKFDIVRDADVIYLHWIAGNFLAVKDIKALANLRKPIIFFMHDMWLMTGGCHHAFSCRNYETGCSDCPMFRSHKKRVSRQAKMKAKLFASYENFHFVSPSKWLDECAAKSFILKNRQHSIISNVIDETVFKPLDRKNARKILNLPQDAFVITFGCQAGTRNAMKGWEYLKDALNEIVGDNILLLVFGSDYQMEISEQLKYPVRFLGPLNDEISLALVDNVSNLFVSPSLAESFGLTFLENTLCGVPVVGFDCTAVPELVQTGINGYLAKYKDANDLAKGIQYFIDNRFEVRKNETYSSKRIIQAHLTLMNTLLKGLKLK